MRLHTLSSLTLAIVLGLVACPVSSFASAPDSPGEAPPGTAQADGTQAASGTSRSRPSGSARSRRREPKSMPDGRPTSIRQDKRTPTAAASPARRSPTTVERARVTHPTVAAHPPTVVKIPYTGPAPAATVSLAHSRDHRFAHPRPHWVRPLPGHPVPAHRWYRPWYTHWWVHPYYRWMHATVVFVHFDFTPDPWGPAWLPPPRAGWDWVPGHWAGAIWVPGHWRPIAPAPAWYRVPWRFVPGFWAGPIYVEGYWRQEARPDWVWVEGEYLADGSYLPGHWEPVGPGPEGYVWEPGFWDGQDWIEGYWRPAARAGYRWVSAHYDPDGSHHAGYWEPLEQRAGWVWIPGWFDGDQWQPGYWVKQSDYDNADPDAWTPPEGWDDGWDNTTPPPSADESDAESAPLALPVGANP